MIDRRKLFGGTCLLLFILLVLSLLPTAVSTSQSWLDNPNFDTSDGWVFNIVGDSTDVNGIIESGSAKLSLRGEKGTKVFSENGTGWAVRDNENDMNRTDDYDIRDNGWWATHYWPDNDPQLVKIQWHKNFSMGVDMSDYKITSASFETWINATVDAVGDYTNGGVDCINDTSVNDMGNGDYIQYFVLISDVSKNREFELTSYQTKKLGCDIGNINVLNDTKLIPLSEDTLKFYLEEVLKFDSSNFSLTVGFLIWCEDNFNPGDHDDFTDIYMKNLTLSIEYEKKIDQFSSVSLKQVGEEVTGKNLVISEANLSFTLSIDNPQILNSRLSELLIKINGKEYTEQSIKLIDINTTTQEFRKGGLDVSNYIQKDEPISISIDVIVKEDFQLNDSVSILIDDVYLYLNIIEVSSEDWSPLIIGLIITIIASISVFISYNKYFKHPPLVRKIRKLKRKIKKDKNIKEISSVRTKSRIRKDKINQNFKIFEKRDKETSNPKKEKIRKNDVIAVLFLIFIVSFSVINPFVIKTNFKSKTLGEVRIGTNSDTITQQWLKNNQFSTNTDWFGSYGLIGDKFILNTKLENDRGNFYVLGKEETFLVCSGTPNNSITSEGWKNTTNSRITAKPSRGYAINDNGCYASHEWEEGSSFGDDLLAQQNTAIQWDKNVQLSDDMSRFIITGANFKVKVNATVSATSGNLFPQPNNNDGLEPFASEASGDRFDIGDYLRFYAILSNPSKNISYTVAELQPAGLGNDSAGEFDYLNDTIIEPTNMNDFLFYLTEVLKTDNHNFTLTLGMEFYCEDDWSTDWDFFDEVYIKECNFSFTYQKLIRKYSSISLNQITEKVPGGNVEILDSKVKLNYSIDQEWPANLSTFSELRISINNNTLPTTILLGDINTTSQTLELNTKSYIVKNKEIYFSLEIFIANQFNYDQNITISINNVDLLISYRFIETPPNLLPLAIGLTIGLLGLVIGITAYQLYFKYPPMVRKIHKLKRKIRKDKEPGKFELKDRNLLLKNLIVKKTNNLNILEKEKLNF